MNARHMWIFLFAVLCLGLAACSGSIHADPDAGSVDAADAGPGDAGGQDAGGQDAGGQDAGGGDDAGAGPDEDCVDVDHDGHCRDADCDDRDPDVHPGMDERCGNAVDDNCDGQVDEGCYSASVFFIDKDSIGGTCSDDHPGTMSQPWCSIGKANAALTAGQTVSIRAGTYFETIQPANSGSSDTSRIVYRNHEGEQVTLEGGVYCLRLIERDYVSVIGIRFFNCERNVYFDGSHHNHLGYCEFDTPAGPVTWAGSRIYHGSSYNRIHHCSFSRYGSETYYADSYQDYGCVLDIGNDNEIDRSDHNLIEHSTFYYGGHHILGVYSNFNVVRHNTFHNEEWYECHREEIGGLCGDRDVILNTSYADENIRNVIEDNFIVFAGVPPDQVSSSGLSVRTQFNIIRRNIFYYCDSSGLALSVDGGNHNDASHNAIYANVFYKNGYLLLDDWDPRKNGLMLARWVDDAEHNPTRGVHIRNNIFHENLMHAIYYYYVDPDEQIAADNWEHEGDPRFVDLEGEPDPFDFEVFDFHLRADSPCIDRGGFLTRATGSGARSTTLRVEHAGVFSDGRGLVAGDFIQLEGQTATVQISSIDYASNTLSLASPLDWQPGTGVSLPYSGQQPDQGAYEHP
ncbi:MAG: hypothetical protein JXR96_26445 [Deltaproteobacteria bacterium]|nr:hypothetical protein [Deltaproteobacteria bacterium]